MPNTAHLSLIQGVINRLANNSFLLKGWTVSLVAGLSALAAADSNGSFAWIAVFAVTVFALLDAYYLALERAYRALYKSAAARSGSDWNLSVDAIRPVAVFDALTSVSIWPLHGIALAVAIGVALGTA
jgi:hypothetical protein